MPPGGAVIPFITDLTARYDEDAGKFQMWFGYPALDVADDVGGLRLRTGYAESSDRLAWTISAGSANAQTARIPLPSDIGVAEAGV